MLEDYVQILNFFEGAKSSSAFRAVEIMSVVEEEVLVVAILGLIRLGQAFSVIYSSHPGPGLQRDRGEHA